MTPPFAVIRRVGGHLFSGRRGLESDHSRKSRFTLAQINQRVHPGRWTAVGLGSEKPEDV